MSNNNNNYDLSGYMSREQIDNIANNMWRIENKRNSMIDRVLQRQADESRRLKEEGYKKKIESLEKDLTDAKNENMANMVAKVENNIERYYELAREDRKYRSEVEENIRKSTKAYVNTSESILSEYISKIDECNNELNNAINSILDKINDIKDNFDNSLDDSLNEYFNTNLQDKDYSSLTRSYNDMHTITDTYNIDESIEDYIKSRSRTLSCEMINDKIGKSDISVFYKYFSNYIRKYLTDYYEDNYKELNIVTEVKFKDYITELFPFIDVEDKPIYDMITIIFNSVNTKNKSINDLEVKKAICEENHSKNISYYKEMLQRTEEKQRDEDEKNLIRSYEDKLSLYKSDLDLQKKRNQKDTDEYHKKEEEYKANIASVKKADVVDKIFILCVIILLGILVYRFCGPIIKLMFQTFWILFKKVIGLD